MTIILRDPKNAIKLRRKSSALIHRRCIVEPATAMEVAITTMFKLVCESCGLSVREAAKFLGAKLDTVKSWSSGRNPAPESVIEKLT